MGRTLLQTGRIVMMLVWFVFILLAFNAPRLVLPTEGVEPFYLFGYCLLVGYAGLGMMLGLFSRFMAERKRAEAEKFVGI